MLQRTFTAAFSQLDVNGGGRHTGWDEQTPKQNEKPQGGGGQFFPLNSWPGTDV